MKTRTKRTFGITILILIYGGLYAAMFGSAWGILVERGWEFWGAFGVVVTLFVGLPSAVGLTLLALHLYVQDG